MGSSPSRGRKTSAHLSTYEEAGHRGRDGHTSSQSASISPGYRPSLSTTIIEQIKGVLSASNKSTQLQCLVHNFPTRTRSGFGLGFRIWMLNASYDCESDSELLATNLRATEHDNSLKKRESCANCSSVLIVCESVASDVRKCNAWRSEVEEASGKGAYS